MSYAKENIGKRPEEIAYGSIKDNKLEMKIYSNNKETTIINPSIQNIIHLVQLRDILCHTGHGFIIYELVRNNEGNIIDTIIIEYGCGIGASYASSKITRDIINTPSGEEFVSNLYSLFLSKK